MANEIDAAELLALQSAGRPTHLKNTGMAKELSNEMSMRITMNTIHFL
ncbi:MAG: hypothetical protein JRG97_10105 [Deltaproteobacteria bacterium]|nr:hypothetical protein [Deltaproteobacteria bacterium]MBW2052889.1 hypothetical protein [Deltaproteobacteria bacterium]MBW2141407.1 hypothetical protein [Deltaproteobacteria bacterium]MBW2324015.1 hypothetical protein [Deltaproteobacteria bacterium]